MAKTTVIPFLISSMILFLLFACKSDIFNPEDITSKDRILFIRDYKKTSEICSINPDGTDLQIIRSHNYENEPIAEFYYQAIWSPDKQKIAICGGPRGSNDAWPLWLMDNQGTLLNQLSYTGSSPNWSVDGNEILFLRGIHPIFFIVNVNTLEERQAVSSDSFTWMGADWSIDEDHILTSENYVFTNEDGKVGETDHEVVLLNISTEERILLTDNEVMDDIAQWSPDESKIAYVSGTYGQGYQIKIMNHDGTDKKTITDTLASYQTIQWSPDGTNLAFNKEQKLEGYAKYAEGSDLFVIDITSGDVKQMTNFAADSIRVFVQDWK